MSTEEQIATPPARICDVIRSRIITGNLRPGDRIYEGAIATEFGVSRIPVREAFNVLVGQGFLLTKPNRGTTVAGLDPLEASDLLEIRSVLEPLAARQAASRRTDDNLIQLKGLVSDGRKAAETGNFSDVVLINSDFHDAIAVASGNPTLIESIRQIRFRTDRFDNVDIAPRAMTSIHEHSEIVRAIEERQAVRAERLAVLHAAVATDAYRPEHASGEDPTLTLLE